MCCSLCVQRGRGWGVKGARAQTRLSLGITVHHSSSQFNCQGRWRGLSTIAPEAFIMGPFVLFLLSTAINNIY